MAKKGHPSARKAKKPATSGTGGHGRRALEGKGPTPKAEDRSWHPAGKRKAAKERLETVKSRFGSTPAPQKRTVRPISVEAEMVTGRNSVIEALRAKIPATTLHIATKIDMDDRVRESIALANKRGIPLLEIPRPELDRLTGADTVHQGIALSVPPYTYAHPLELAEKAEAGDSAPVFVALDGITDPRNLGAIVRSVAAFGGYGVIVPKRRSVGVNAAAWKTSAGAIARTPVAMAANLTQTLKSFKDRGYFVVGLDGEADSSLPVTELAGTPLLIVVGSEGKGLSRLITETCDVIVSIPMSGKTESLNAGIAASVVLYEISRQKLSKKKS
ncbi:MAG: 23S rRNA (guanosine(2251)-2'-O)-methyltransferase RlmB [Pontimonas sp.]|nr:23S rRNA (guanosine(2251)-2'-O)-methyltransferase RlmB [Pontimonas sp.]MDP4816154.1 23S rRNA (guanosine(2251)-2'-O)-methyltransferase RlmB [Pontimonas sp.]MDP4972567.1 23S rRNA (guanosine(2251)-2'-O)-methyltransferase RlmB [Pontimonas sp.]MDP5128974.1 23S rRNA (guanosine(2251)-2'-O)-methyltransferase RlmB [Pontimonas sp.]